MEQYPAIKINELSGNRKTCRNFKSIFLSERSHTLRFQIYNILKKVKPLGAEKPVVTRVWGVLGGGIGGRQRTFRAQKLFC